jgi:hygromycin-B 4-O-kinase
MASEKMNLTEAQVGEFQTELSQEAVTDVVALVGGEWSQAFGFRQGGKDYVIRFNPSDDDFLHDEYASKFGSQHLPIPKIIRIGTGFDGHFAISERAFGTMIDDLDAVAVRRILPSLFSTLTAIREADVSDSTGFGLWDEAGNGLQPSWKDVLLNVGNADYNSVLPGWREALGQLPNASELFALSYQKLSELAEDLPETRSLIHNDLLHSNVLTNDDQITAVFDWGFAMYGDFLYDLAQFAFWAPLHDNLKDVDWVAEAQKHYQNLDVAVPGFEQRLGSCLLHYGLDVQTFFAYKHDWSQLASVISRTLEIANE